MTVICLVTAFTKQQNTGWSDKFLHKLKGCRIRTEEIRTQLQTEKVQDYRLQWMERVQRVGGCST
jgi:hypothetical protein